MNTGSIDLSQYSNLEPTVVALLEPVPGVTTSAVASVSSSNTNTNDSNDNSHNNNNNEAEQTSATKIAAPEETATTTTIINTIRTRVAMIKLEQSRIRGNSNYAAKIMDFAIEEGVRDRESYLLLDNYSNQLNDKINEILLLKKNTNSNNKNNSTGNHHKQNISIEIDDNNYIDITSNDKNNNNNNINNSNNLNNEIVQQIQQKLDNEKERCLSVIDILFQHVTDELQCIQSEQKVRKEREEYINSRIRTVSNLLPNLFDLVSSISLSVQPKQQQHDHHQQQQDLSSSTSSILENHAKKAMTTATTVSTTTTAVTDDVKSNTDESSVTSTSREIDISIAEQNNKKSSKSHTYERIQQQQGVVQQLGVVQQQVQVQEQYNAIQATLKDIKENQCTIIQNIICSVCYENNATKAIIPCGHLCICNSCTIRITKNYNSNGTVRQCPICRGNLLSTLHIYTS